jgi:hypothetical protein
MRFCIAEIAVITAHNLTAFATGITKHNLVTAHSEIRSIADPVVLISERHYLSPPQPVPRKITAGAVKTLAIG